MMYFSKYILRANWALIFSYFLEIEYPVISGQNPYGKRCVALLSDSHGMASGQWIQLRNKENIIYLTYTVWVMSGTSHHFPVIQSRNISNPGFMINVNTIR